MEGRMAGNSDEEALAECYRSFIETFNRGDGAEVARLLGYPYMVGGSGQVTQVTPDEPTGRAMFANAFGRMKAGGWARTQIDHLEAVALGGDTGVVAADFSRWRADGSKLDCGSGHYIARKFGGHWKIVASIFADNGLFTRRN